VLVVEDNQVNQMVAVGLLEALGYDADVADDGYAAIEAYDPSRHAAVLMDVQMPRLDGYAATRAIRERGGTRVPVIAMTAAAVEGERERCLAAGMDDFLTKPVDPDQLAATLRRWVDDGARPAPEEPAEAASAAADEPPLDLERLDMLRDLAPGNTSYLDRAIGNFDATSPEHLAAVRQAVVARDPAALLQAAHRLSGSAANLGVLEVAAAARGLEVLADGGSTDGAEELLEPLGPALETSGAPRLPGGVRRIRDLRLSRAPGGYGCRVVRVVRRAGGGNHEEPGRDDHRRVAGDRCGRRVPARLLRRRPRGQLQDGGRHRPDGRGRPAQLPGREPQGRLQGERPRALGVRLPGAGTVAP
jgi:CheY-like chemotaxis protein/HPt (histidine-containing phosphotransfer) domain-containing protein